MEKDGIFKPTYMYYVIEAVKIAILFYSAYRVVTMKTHTVWTILFAALLHAFGN